MNIPKFKIGDKVGINKKVLDERRGDTLISSRGKVGKVYTITHIAKAISSPVKGRYKYNFSTPCSNWWLEEYLILYRQILCGGE